jgi:hypothetical protein
MNSEKKTLIVQAEVQITPDSLFKAISGVLADIPAAKRISVNFVGAPMRAALRKKLRNAGYTVATDRATGAIQVTRPASASSAFSAVQTPGDPSR